MKIGVDIGGTKCAVVLGDENGIAKKIKFQTTTYTETIQNIIHAIREIGEGDAIGISCGGPLDAKNGIILSPPNLPGWDEVHITEMLQAEFHIPAYLCNDADACALAEWKFGAGKGTSHMIFLTFGTGMGAGLILNGKLYSGACGMAGEVGHIRMAAHGPSDTARQAHLRAFAVAAVSHSSERPLRLRFSKPAKHFPIAKPRQSLTAFLQSSLQNMQINMSPSHSKFSASAEKSSARDLLSLSTS